MEDGLSVPQLAVFQHHRYRDPVSMPGRVCSKRSSVWLVKYGVSGFGPAEQAAHSGRGGREKGQHVLAFAVDEGIGESGPAIVVAAAHRQSPKGPLCALIGKGLRCVD